MIAFFNAVIAIIKLTMNFLYAIKAEFKQDFTACVNEGYADASYLLEGAGTAPFKTKESDGTTVHKITLSDGTNFFLKCYPPPLETRLKALVDTPTSC